MARRRLNDRRPSVRRRRGNGVLATLLLVLGAAAVGWVARACVRCACRSELAIEADCRRRVPRAQEPHRPRGGGRACVGRRTALKRAGALSSKIVGRDVTVLDEAGVARAAIESAAENFSDGVDRAGVLVRPPRPARPPRLQAREHRQFHDRPPLAAPRSLRLGGGAPRRCHEFRAGAPFSAADRRRGVSCRASVARAARSARLSPTRRSTSRRTPAGRRRRSRARSAWRSAARAATERSRSTAPGSIRRAGATPDLTISAPRSA